MAVDISLRFWTGEAAITGCDPGLHSLVNSIGWLPGQNPFRKRLSGRRSLKHVHPGIVLAAHPKSCIPSHKRIVHQIIFFLHD